MPDNTIVTKWLLDRSQFLEGVKELRDAIDTAKSDFAKPISVTLKPVDLVSPKIAQLHALAAKPIEIKIKVDEASYNSAKAKLQSLVVGQSVSIGTGGGSSGGFGQSFSGGGAVPVANVADRKGNLMNAQYCPNCGNVNRPGASHCSRCGANLKGNIAQRAAHRIAQGARGAYQVGKVVNGAWDSLMDAGDRAMGFNGHAGIGPDIGSVGSAFMTAGRQVSRGIGAVNRFLGITQPPKTLDDIYDQSEIANVYHAGIHQNTSDILDHLRGMGGPRKRKRRRPRSGGSGSGSTFTPGSGVGPGGTGSSGGSGGSGGFSVPDPDRNFDDVAGGVDTTMADIDALRAHLQSEQAFFDPSTPLGKMRMDPVEANAVANFRMLDALARNPDITGHPQLGRGQYAPGSLRAQMRTAYSAHDQDLLGPGTKIPRRHSLPIVASAEDEMGSSEFDEYDAMPKRQGMGRRNNRRGAVPAAAMLEDTFKALRVAATYTADAFRHAATGVGSFISGLMPQGPAGPAEAAAMAGGGGGAGRGGPNLGRARGLSGLLRGAAVSIGGPAILGYAAQEAVSEFTAYEKRQAGHQLNMQLAQARGGRAGIAEATGERLKDQMGAGDEGMLTNFLWFRNWGGGNSIHAKHKRQYQHFEEEQIKYQQAMEYVGQSSGSYSDMLHGSLAGPGRTSNERAVNEITEEKYNRSNARFQKFLANKETMSEGKAIELRNLQEKADDAVIAGKTGRLNEIQNFERGQFLAGQGNLRTIAEDRMAGRLQSADMDQYLGGRAQERAKTIGTAAGQYREGGDEAKEFDKATNAQKKYMEQQQKIAREQANFNSALKVQNEIQDGILQKVNAVGHTEEAHNMSLIVQEQQKVKLAEKALELETDRDKVPLRQAEVASARAHMEDVKEAIRLEKEYQTAIINRQTAGMKFGVTSSNTGNLVGMMNQYGDAINAAAGDPAKQAALRQQMGVAVENNKQSGAISNWQLKESAYETQLRANGADRMADQAHIHAEAALEQEKIRATQAELANQIKLEKDPDKKKALMDQATQLSERSGLIGDKEKADINLTMRNSVSFSSSLDYWKKNQMGRDGVAKPVGPPPRLGHPGNGGFVPPNLGPEHGLGPPVLGPPLPDMRGNQAGNNPFAPAVKDFGQAVDKWNQMLNNSLKLAVVGQ